MVLYYLSAVDLQEYEALLAEEYPHQIITLPFQRFLVFQVQGKEYAAIAWPTLDGKLTGRSVRDDTLFDTDADLQRQILPMLANKAISVIAFPRYE